MGRQNITGLNGSKHSWNCLLFISLWMQFWCVTVIVTFSNVLLIIFLWFCAPFWWQNIDIHLIFSMFRPTVEVMNIVYDWYKSHHMIILATMQLTATCLLVWILVITRLCDSLSEFPMSVTFFVLQLWHGLQVKAQHLMTRQSKRWTIFWSSTTSDWMTFNLSPRQTVWNIKVLRTVEHFCTNRHYCAVNTVSLSKIRTSNICHHVQYCMFEGIKHLWSL
jgi:hypothetical protein